MPSFRAFCLVAALFVKISILLQFKPALTQIGQTAHLKESLKV